jgi:hypothetical protein
MNALPRPDRFHGYRFNGFGFNGFGFNGCWLHLLPVEAGRSTQAVHLKGRSA